MLAVTESGADTFYAFFSDGILRDHNGDPILDRDGNYLYDGWANIAVMAAGEPGADVAALTGIVLPIVGDLVADEPVGLDTAALMGRVRIAGAIATTENTADLSDVVGDVLVKGGFAAAETGADLAVISGANILTGSFALSEIGLDVAAVVGDTLVDGRMAAEETGNDTLNASDGLLPIGQLITTEIGPDTAHAVGGVRVTGGFALSEIGYDTTGIVGISGVVTDTESIIPLPRYKADISDRRQRARI